MIGFIVEQKDPNSVEYKDFDIKWRKTLLVDGPLSSYNINITKYYNYLMDRSETDSAYLYPFYDDVIYDSTIRNLTDYTTDISDTRYKFYILVSTNL